MHMTGEEFIPAPRQKVWAALNDEEVLKRCIPGCQEISRHSPTELEVQLQIKFGPLKAHFSGSVTLSDIDPPNGYRIEGKGNGLVGMVNGGATIKLADAEGGTTLSYEADAQVAGKLASIGGRLIDSSSAQLTTRFFERFAEEVKEMGDGELASPKTPPRKSGAKSSRASVKSAAPKKPAPKKPASRKPMLEKAAAAKVEAKKPGSKKPGSKKPAAKKSAAKKPASRKTSAKKALAKKKR